VIEQACAQIAPHRVYTMCGEDHHQDHRTVHEASSSPAAASRRSSATRAPAPCRSSHRRCSRTSAHSWT
jgi:LmbE family N-acetylglucosaminyl deacetylase